MTKFERIEQVRFRQVDFAGIVFYPRFLEMLNDLVEDFFEIVLNKPFSKIHQTNGIPTVDLKIQFKVPARIGDVLTKQLWIEKLGSASLDAGFRFINQDDKMVLEGVVTLVNVELDKVSGKMRSSVFGDDVRSVLKNYMQ